MRQMPAGPQPSLRILAFSFSFGFNNAKILLLLPLLQQETMGEN